MPRGRPRVGRSSYTDVAPLMDAAIARDALLRIECATEAVAIRTVYRMNQYRIICRQEHPELKSEYDPFVYRRKGKWIEIDKRGAPDVLQITDEDGNQIPLEIIRTPSRIPIHEIDVAKYETPGDNDEIEEAIKRLHRERTAMLKHGPHRIDPNKPLLDDEGEGA